MTITSPYTPASFNGSGTTGPFSFTFRILDKTNIKVEKVVGTTVTTLTEGVGAGQYSIVLVAAGLSGGQITLGTALAIGERLIVSRVTPRTQLEKLADLRRFNAEIHERAFDKATMVIQETEYQGSASVKFPTADTPGLNQTLPIDSARANKVMAFDAQGQPVVSLLSLSKLDDFEQAVIDVQSNKDATDANVITTGNNATAAQNAQAAAESAAAGMKWRPSVRVATTGNITLSGTQVIDGVSVIVGDAVLVWQQSSPAQNGVYIVASGAWSRRSDADTWAELISQAVSVEEGSAFSDFSFICTVNSGGTLGSTAVTWSNSFNAVRDGGVSTAAKIVDGIITYVKTAASSIATTAEALAGTASKFIDAATFKLTALMQQTTVLTVTSGTTASVNIPTGAKRIIIDFIELSPTAIDSLRLRLGDAGGVETTGYSAGSIVASAATAYAIYTDGFKHRMATAAAGLATGRFTLTLFDASTNTWLCEGTAHNGIDSCCVVDGYKSLSQELSSIQLDWASASSFDGSTGKVSVKYEY